MDYSFDYLRRILDGPTLSDWCLFRCDEESLYGKLQYCGPHFGAAFRYALKLGANNNDRFTILEELASETNEQKIVTLVVSYLAHIREFFAVQKLHNYLSDINSNPVDNVASFIEFLVEVLERLSSRSLSWIIIPGEINILRQRLNFLLVIIRDTPFQCAEPEERNNILVEIEFVANKVGMFLYSFFFTANHVSTATMDMELHLLLSKFEVAEETIKKQFVMTLEQPEFTTSNLTCAYIYIIDSLLDDLNDLLNHKINLALEVKDQITTFYEELYSCRSMLRDTNLMQIKESMKYQMQLIDLTYEAEYIIAYFATGEVPGWYLSFRLHSFILKSNAIRASLTKLKLNSGLANVRVTEGSAEVFSSQVIAKSIPIDEITVGFEETRRQVTSGLIGGPKRLQIIAIIGMGGLGKTTLARKLYNDSNVLLHFERRCWCVISQTYQKTKLLRDILSSILTLNEDEISNMEDHQLADHVYKSLKGTRYLLVVDDIWKKEAWDDLKRYFPEDENGSRILFTSRNKDVALQFSCEPIIHALPFLSADECWDLLQKIVFPNSLCPGELQDVGKYIARNSKGLPLAVVGIAAVLANMDKKERLWQEIATNLISYISQDQDILELSYWNLPSHLKPCFLFLGMFEEDNEIVVRESLYLWVSAGLIPKSEHKILEDVAENYLLELINWNMVQVVKRRSDNGVKTFVMHDLIRDMCLRLGDKENFLKVMNKKSSTYGQHHHIFVHSDYCDLTSRQLGLCTRSLFCTFKDLHAITSTMKRLRVLKLLNYGMMYDGTALRSLDRLRHLECAGTLCDFGSHMNLEFLTIRNGLILGDTQLDMPKLRHLHFGYVDKYILDISKCPSLQTLSSIYIHDLEDVGRLRQLFQLRHLRCYDIDLLRKDPPELKSLTQLVSLRISGSYETKFYPKYFPIHIRKLSISTMFMSCELLSSIGIMPHLEILKLEGVQFEEMRWKTNDGGFQMLKFLNLNCVPFKEWSTSEDHFPMLEHLVLSRCQNLNLLPSDLGYIPTLQRIEVFQCAKNIKNSAKHIQEEQEEQGNEQLKIIIFGIDEDEDGDKDEDKDGDEDE